MKYKKLVSTIFSVSLCVLALSGCESQTVNQNADTEKNAVEEVSQEVSGKEEAPEENKELTAKSEYAQNLVIEDGQAQPMLEYSDYLHENYSNAESDILRFTVYVETDNDTDNDGMADLVKVFVQVPKAAAEGKYKAGVIYDPTPYGAGTADSYWGAAQKLYYEERFDYDLLYKDCEKRNPGEEVSSIEQALTQDSEEWNYKVPTSHAQGFEYGKKYDYYLIRGFAVVEASGIGTYGSEGFELCGYDLERDSHKCVVEWLTGNRVAYTDRYATTTIKADWSNGNVAMTGCSYGGTLPFEVATTGVEGLKTIIPYAGIASWYDYTNSQGVPKRYDTNYAEQLASYNGGALFLDNDWLVIRDDYGSWLYTVAQDQKESNGDYWPIWEMTDYSDDYENINCSALIVHGLNDFNVTTKQADLMYTAFRQANQNVKLVLHQDGHNFLYGQMMNDKLWDETMNKWLTHYLYGVDNGIDDELPNVSVQDNISGEYKEYSRWRNDDLQFNYVEAAVQYDSDVNNVTTNGLIDYIDAYYAYSNDASAQGDFLLNASDRHAAIYDVELPENFQIYGVPKVSIKATTTKENFDGVMITAALVDTVDGETLFKAYRTYEEISDTVPTKTIGKYEYGGGHGKGTAKEFVQSNMTSKAFTMGWTDMANPGGGYDSKDYASGIIIESDKEYDYTFYLMPTVYTIAPEHKLKLVITSWDPYTNSWLDESQGSDDEEQIEFYNYDFTIINDSIKLELPVAE